MEREELISIIKIWVKNENEIRVLQKELKRRKDENKTTSDKLLGVMKMNNIDVFDIRDGKVLYKQNKVKKPISNKLLLDVFTKYFDGNHEKAEELGGFINQHRNIVTKESIKFTGDFSDIASIVGEPTTPSITS